MNTKLTRENRILYKLVESKAINAISNGGVREKVDELYKRSYYILISLEIFQVVQIQIQIARMKILRTRKAAAL